MTDSPNEYVIRVIRGPGKGQEFQLTKQETTIGTADSCDLAQAGQYMSDLHAIIEKRGDDAWYLVNKSPNGSFINRNRVDSHALSDGDYLQLGSEVLLQFGVKAVSNKKGFFGKKKKPDEPVAEFDETGEQDAKPSILKEKPGLVYGVGGYLVVIIALAIFFMTANFDDVTPGLDQAEVQTALEETRTLLQAQEELPGIYKVDADKDSTALFYSIIAAAELYENGTQRGENIDRLIAEIDRRFFVAWNLEKRSQFALAINEYESIIEMAPDIRIPTTALASRRLAYIRGEFASG